MALERVRLEAADDDLDAIWLYVAADNPRAADSLIDAIETAEWRLSEFPGLGRARPELGPDVRSWTVQGYIMLYRAIGSTLLIERIIHGARDTAAVIDKHKKEL